MPEFAFRHAVHNAADRIVHVAGGDVTCHHLRNRQLQNRNSDIGHCAHDVALRQNADEAPAGVEDDQHADAMRGEQLRRRCQIGCRFDADDVAALGGENRLQAHARLPDAFLATLWSGASVSYRGRKGNAARSGLPTKGSFWADGLVPGIKSHMIEAPSKATAAILRNAAVRSKFAAIKPKSAVLRAAPIPDAVPMMP